MTGPGVGALVGLIKAVARLSLPAEAQLAYLRDLGVLPSIDELALELHDYSVLLPQFIEYGWITSDEGVAIQALADELAHLGDAAGTAVWTEESLATSPAWEEIRARSRSALVL
jgi:hypothetical protein